LFHKDLLLLCSLVLIVVSTIDYSIDTAMTLTMMIFRLSLALLACSHVSLGFTVVQLGLHRPTVLFSTTKAETEAVTDKGLFKSDRYIATNRFAVRKGQNAKFEKRWATRKSRLAQLDGFRYFHLMRRVTLNEDGSTKYNEGDTDESAMENYVSFTVWNKKSDFSAWRSGEAFKEAHGGTSIGAFLSTMINSAVVLRGPPRPAFYDSLFMESSQPEQIPETVDGWRNIQLEDGKTLPAECLVQLEKYFIPKEKAEEFEKAWLVKKSSTPNNDGLMASSLMRRDGQAKGHGTVEMAAGEPTYVAAHIFDNRDSFEEWSKDCSGSTECASLSAMPPEKVYYEGALVISSMEGA
jgi:heme-degrading monooxygenase HmoA